MFSGSRLVSSTTPGCDTGIFAARSASATPRPASTSTTSRARPPAAIAGPRRFWSSYAPAVPSVTTRHARELARVERHDARRDAVEAPGRAGQHPRARDHDEGDREADQAQARVAGAVHEKTTVLLP